MDPTSKQALARQIFQRSHLNGSFILRSGQTATDYFDKYQFEAEPALLAEICKHMNAQIPLGTQVLAGLEMGGIPVVTMLSHFSGLPASFVRKVAKSYGTARLSEGTGVDGKRVLIVEDVVTSAGQIVLSATELRKLGATVEYAICAIYRGQGGTEALARIGIKLIALFTRSDFPF